MRITARGRVSRLGQYVLVVWVAATLNFALPHLAPGDPVYYLYGGESSLDAAQLATVRASYGLDDSLLTQYRDFWVGLAHGDLGTSIEYNRPVSDVILERLPWTLVLVGLSTLLAAVLGTLLGTFAAWRRARRSDTSVLIGVLAVDAMPGFWIGMLLISIFSVELSWFPSYGGAAITAEGTGWLREAARRLVLPVATIVLASMGTFFLLARASMVSVLDEPYVRLARAKGISERRVATRHALRTALLPVYTNLTIAVGGLLSGAVVVETVFAYPGLGRLFYDAVTVRDYPLLQAGFLVVTLGIIAANLVAELTYPLLDPRVRRHAGAAQPPVEPAMP